MIVKSFFLETYGCQMNEYDSGLLESLLVAAGLKKAHDEKSADLVILNTCSVRHKAEERALGRIRSVAGAPGQKEIAVIGCMAQRLGDQLLSENKNVKYVLGTDNFYRLAEILKSGNGSPVVDTSCREEPLDLVTSGTTKVSSYVTIMRGCNNYCSYCIVPYVRGRERFRPPEKIVEEMRLHAASGVNEIWLLGQNVNSYEYNSLDFSGLLQYLLKESSLPRIRFLTSHPKDLSDKLIDIMAGEDRICGGIHLPLQSGSNSVLKKMNRKYTAEQYLQKIRTLREKLPSVIITTDIIVGFSGESEDDYQATRDLMNEIEFNSAFMFRYSVRSGTKAEEFGDDVPEEVKLSRLDDLIRFQKDISERKMAAFVGSRQEVLIEEPARQDSGDARGKSDGGINVVVKNASDKIGELVNVKIISSSYTTLVGELTSG